MIRAARRSAVRAAPPRRASARSAAPPRIITTLRSRRCPQPPHPAVVVPEGRVSSREHKASRADRVGRLRRRGGTGTVEPPEAALCAVAGSSSHFGPPSTFAWSTYVVAGSFPSRQHPHRDDGVVAATSRADHITCGLHVLALEEVECAAVPRRDRRSKRSAISSDVMLARLALAPPPRR